MGAEFTQSEGLHNLYNLLILYILTTANAVHAAGHTRLRRLRRLADLFTRKLALMPFGPSNRANLLNPARYSPPGQPQLRPHQVTKLTGLVCQISCAYCAIVRSEENGPIPATFKIALRVQAFGSP